MTERYQGEQMSLRCFLLDLMPVVEHAFGRSTLLYQAIRRGLARDSLEAMRTARQIFNNLPREDRQLLSEGLVERSRCRALGGHRQPARRPVLQLV